MTDFFLPTKSKKEQVYDFIKSRGRARTSEVIKFASSIFSNRGDRDARLLCEEGRVYRLNHRFKVIFYPGAKEDIYTVYKHEAEGLA